MDSPVWRCGVMGLFGSSGGVREGGVLHGIQLGLPFPGVAAVVYDGGAHGVFAGGMPPAPPFAARENFLFSALRRASVRAE